MRKHFITYAFSDIPLKKSEIIEVVDKVIAKFKKQTPDAREYSIQVYAYKICLNIFTQSGEEFKEFFLALQLVDRRKTDIDFLNIDFHANHEVDVYITTEDKTELKRWEHTLGFNHNWTRPSPGLYYIHVDNKYYSEETYIKGDLTLRYYWTGYESTTRNEKRTVIDYPFRSVAWVPLVLGLMLGIVTTIANLQKEQKQT